MYYQELIHKFWEFSQKAQLSTAAVAIYLYLLKLANDNDSYNVTVSDSSIGAILGITRKTVKSAREILGNSGLIQYNNKKGYSNSYRIVLDYPLENQKQEKFQKGDVIRNVSKLLEEENKILPSVELPALINFQTNEHNETSCIGHRIFESSKKNNAPSLDEFMAYACTLSGYEKSLDSAIKEKYVLWETKDWCNNLGKPITNWKSSLKNILPYLNNNKANEPLSIKSIPAIKPPK